MASHPATRVDPNRGPGRHPTARLRLPVAGVLLAALAVSAGCSAGTTATDAVVPTPESATSSTTSQSQSLAIDRIVQGAVDVLSTSTELAWAKYQEVDNVDNPRAEAAAEADFVRTATARGVPASVAKDMATSLLATARDVEVRLMMQWNTAVEPPPSSPPKGIQAELTPRMAQAEEAIAMAMGDLASGGLPADWSAPLNEARARAELRLPPGVTAEDLSITLAPLAQWQPAPTSTPKSKRRAKSAEPATGR